MTEPDSIQVLAEDPPFAVAEAGPVLTEAERDWSLAVAEAGPELAVEGRVVIYCG